MPASTSGSLSTLIVNLSQVVEAEDHNSWLALAGTYDALVLLLYAVNHVRTNGHGYRAVNAQPCETCGT